MTAARPAEASSDAVIQTLKWIRKHGFKPVALRKQSKAAIDEKFADAGYAPPPDDLWQTRDLGVGVVTGPKQSGPVDIDLDCPEAVTFAKLFLPPTAAVFGRSGKQRSHYLYRVETEEFLKRALIDPVARATIIEMRGDGGHQTVFPGSLHEDTGELIEWSDVAFPEVSRVEPMALERAVKKIAIATLIVRHLWAEGQRNEICKHLAGLFYYLEWSEDETKQLISAIMDFTGDADKTRLRTVTITYKKGEKGGKITGANTLRAFLGDSRIVDRILEWSGSEQAALLQDYNERFAIVTVEGKFRIAETTALEKGGIPVLFAKEDFLNLMAVDKTEIEGKPTEKARVWLANPRRRTYRTMDFVPGAEEPPSTLNLWTGWGVDPDPKGECRAWLDLLYYTICGQDDVLYNWMLHWFANIVREPMNKCATCPVLIGREGAGKSLLLKYFGRILGPSYVVVTKEEHVHGRFNQHLATALLLHSEEALYGGDIKHQGIIRSLITDDFIQFEKKGVDVKQVHNYIRLVLTSNHDRAASVAIGDRRYTVIDLDKRIVSSTVIAQIVKELNTGGPAKLFHYLMNMEYDPAIPRLNVKNETLATMKQINFDPVVSWWHECLLSGQLLPDHSRWASKPATEEWPAIVSSAALHMAMASYMRSRGQRFIPDGSQFAVRLNKLAGTKLSRTQRYFTNPQAQDAPMEVRQLSSKQYTIENMPSLEQCRESFSEFVGQPMKWPAADKAAIDDRPDYEKF